MLPCVWGGVRYIIDITIAWASEMGAMEWRDVGHDADKAARAKDKSYEKALKREAEGGHGWLQNMRGREIDRFIPIAYEMCGTWGTAARSFFKFVVKCAGAEGTRAAELYHWSAMTFGGHWRRRVAVEIGRGRVNCLGRSADPGYKGDSGSSAETAPYALR